MIHIVFSSLLLLIIAIWVKKRIVSQEDTLLFWLGLGLKILSGWALAWMYMYYYHQPTADTFRFHNGLIDFKRVIAENSEYFFDIFIHTDTYKKYFEVIEVAEIPRVGFFVKLLYLFRFIIGSNYWMISAWLSTGGFLASCLLVSKINYLLPNFRFGAWISICFVPSCFFWSSGLLKETLMWGIICSQISIFMDSKYAIAPIKPFQWAVFILFWVVLFEIKFYYFATLSIAMVIGFLVPKDFASRKSNALRLLYFCLILIGIFILLDIFIPQLSYGLFLKTLLENHQITIEFSNESQFSGSYIHYYDLQPTWSSILLNSPLALFSALFRPFIWESNGTLQTILSIQNALVIIFFMAKALRLLKPNAIAPPIHDKSLVYGAVFYIVFTATLLAIASPNFGALERYKTGFYPLFVLLVLYKNPLFEKIVHAFSQSTKKI